MARAKKQVTEFELDVETRFEMTGRGTVTWFNMLEEDKYERIGGNFFPQDPSKLGGIVDDLLTEAEAQAKEAGITVVRIDPIKQDADGNDYYKINRKATKKDGSPAVVKFKASNPKNDYDLDDELGNGSTVALKIYASAYYMPEAVTKVAGMPDIVVPARVGATISPLIVQVIDHKVYDGASDEFENEADDMENTEGGEDEAPFDNEDAAKDDY